MASKSWLCHPAGLMLLLITWRDSMHCYGFTVDPPEDLAVSDPGHLGHLEITWGPPGSLTNMTECSTLYQLEYFNTYRDSWTAIRMNRRTFSAQFDLMKDVRVRVYTLLDGRCTNNTMIQSTSYTELIQKPPSTGPLKPTFVSLQIQNHVKPEITEKLHLQSGPDTQLELHWESPAGKVPEHCLEWEVEHSQEAPGGKLPSKQIVPTQVWSLTLPSSHNDERSCFRVRSKVNKYCADKSFWSDWSRPTCHPEKNEVTPEPEWDTLPVYICVAAAIIVILVLSLCVGTGLKVTKSRQEKKLDSLPTTSFAINSVLTAAEG
ncbi:interleukin-13 receptor subunit alpha-2 isoform X4 [Embiotoca jacksoni]|uniref:interleukin-13 receptor subunit alpha-2 isoform X4 n=1 Tax=Embiotoca jacksoni TaxID=100190 RepID=UPI00370429F2